MPNDGGDRAEEMLPENLTLDVLELEKGSRVGDNPESDLNKAQRVYIEKILADFRLGLISKLPKNFPRIFTAQDGAESYGPDVQFLVNKKPLGRDRRAIVDMKVPQQESKLPDGDSSFEQLLKNGVRFGVGAVLKNDSPYLARSVVSNYIPSRLTELPPNLEVPVGRKVLFDCEGEEYTGEVIRPGKIPVAKGKVRVEFYIGSVPNRRVIDRKLIKGVIG